MILEGSHGQESGSVCVIERKERYWMRFLKGMVTDRNIYKTITGCAGVSPVRWFGKEGLYEVIVLDYLGTSLGDMISGQQSDHREVFSYAPQMVHHHMCFIYI
jgi:hypothetical protein